MTSKLFKTASAFALLAGVGFAAPASAQETSDPATGDPTTMEDPATDPTMEDPATLGESRHQQKAPDQSASLVGQSVVDASGQEVGTVEEVVTGDDGSELAVLSVGEFLGIGEKKIAVATSELQPNAGGTGLTTAMTAEDIEAAPAYEGGESDAWPEEEQY